MKEFQVILNDETAVFYQRVAEKAGLKTERVLADSLFRLAGELALRAAEEARREK